ncbi:MAG: leucine-rich repeat domain-containing protein, partial [Ruminococcus sp.]
MKLWKQVLAAVSAGIVGLSGLQLPLLSGNLLCVSADELTDGLEFTVSGGEATVTGCTSTASEIVIPSDYAGYPVTAIGDSAFYDCDTLVSVTIPQGVTTLGDYAFGYCDYLTTIYMPVSVTSWGYGISYDCLSLSDVYYEGTSTQWESIDQGEANGYLWSSTTHYNYAYPDTDTSDDIEYTVNGLTFTISGGEATVTGCASTASEIVIPSDCAGYPVTAIGDSAFYDCDTLVSVTIPQGVTTLGDYAFGYCDYLTTIYMPVSVTSWGYGVSYDCISLSDVYYEGTSTQWESIDMEDGNGYLLWGSTTHYNYVYPDTDTSDDMEYTVDGLTFTISGGEATVTGCTSTASKIVIPSDCAGYPVTAIGDSAFYNCDTLVSVTIPQGVTTLGDYAFGYCDYLTTIYMPVSVTSWGYGVSYDCVRLSDVYYEGTSIEWGNIDQGSANGYLQNIATIHYNSTETVTTTIPAETTAPVETTVETTTTTTVAEEKSVWSLGKMTVQPEDGMEEDLNFDICIDNAISSYGLQGAIYLPEVTAKLLYWPYMESSALSGDVYSSARLTTNMNEVLYNEGEEIYFALDSSTLMTPETDSGVLMQLTFAVPDEDTVRALAEEYGLQIIATADGAYCYEFPVCWMENGYDEAISDGETIALPRYAYIDSDNQDVFSDNVILEDGYIRVEMPYYGDNTETTATVPETETTTTT